MNNENARKRVHDPQSHANQRKEDAWFPSRVPGEPPVSAYILVVEGNGPDKHHLAVTSQPS